MAKPSEHLIQLYRAAVEAEREATSKPYTKDGWAPWMAAAEAFQRAVTEEAAAPRGRVVDAAPPPSREQPGRGREAILD